MREVYYNSDITPKAINEIKLLSLYYSKINIVNDAVYRPKFNTVNGQFQYSGTEALQFKPESFEIEYKLLIEENLISITKRDENTKDVYERCFLKKLAV